MSAASKIKNWANASKLNLAILALVAVFFIFVVIETFTYKGYAAIQGPKACILCHTMEPYYESWEKSIHAGQGIECMGCHNKPGVTGWINMRVGEASKVAKYTLFSEYRKGPLEKRYEGTAPIENCKNCHEKREAREKAKVAQGN